MYVDPTGHSEENDELIDRQSDLGKKTHEIIDAATKTWNDLNDKLQIQTDKNSEYSQMLIGAMQIANLEAESARASYAREYSNATYFNEKFGKACKQFENEFNSLKITLSCKFSIHEHYLNHLAVQIHTQEKLIKKTGHPILLEASLKYGSKKGNYGRLDLLDTDTLEMWEVKPDNSNWNETSGAGIAQVKRYLEASCDSCGENKKFAKILRAGYQIDSYSFDEDGIHYEVRSGNPNLSTSKYSNLEKCMIYYTATRIKDSSETQHAYAGEKKKETVFQQAKDMATVYTITYLTGLLYAIFGKERVKKALKYAI